MEITSLCLLLSATLSIRPDKSQFFRYDRIYLSCDAPPNSTGWTLRKHNSSETPEPCENGCMLDDVYPSDSGVYWCESEQGKCSNTINITVTAGVVILESPALPVTEGDEVTLSCTHKERYSKYPTSNFTATFYKNNTFISTEPDGILTLQVVSTSDEGFYKCEHPTKGESPQSWLGVTARAQTPGVPLPDMPWYRLVCSLLLFLLYKAKLILCFYMCCRLALATSHPVSLK
ncbi:Fc receptor-like protein 5 isoform X2 [Epinephelus fuscoguttatus]|uniref:Fc receptor-like protein 5 isoform X2 n=1 Tax=Epinephelus fuscoguttatus TaxID=293821 RepID=UPI0020D16280|nr:Fc receptor-like protein 5 isoform X2 [Epinephelus fuscoguttatus]